MNNNDPGPNFLDATAVTVGLASFLQYLPSIAAVLSIIWFLIRIAESETVQHLLGKYAWINKETKRNEEDLD